MVCLAAMMIPVQVLMVPLYIQFSGMNMIDSYWSVILSGLPGAFGVFPDEAVHAVLSEGID